MYNKLSKKVPHICYLTLAGSKSYGTDNENSDTDIRGFYLESKEQLLGLTKYNEEYTDSESDTVLYSFRKFLSLLANCNPNVIELLGTRTSDVLYMTALSREMRMHPEMFLSKRAYTTFSGYATQQFRRLQNALHRDYNKEAHILATLKQEILQHEEDLSLLGEYNLSLEDEIKVSLNVNDVSLRQFLQANSVLRNTIRNYDKIGHRNNKKDDNHLNKHAMHLIRLYYMGIDILEKGEINTYREKEHDLLMTIRNGEMSFDDVFALRDKLEIQLDKAMENCKLPEKCDMDKINRFCVDVLNINLR